VTAGGKQVAGRLRPAPGGRGCRHPGRGARGVHPPSACCGCRGWVPPQWTSNRRRWPGSLLRRLSRCPGRHVLWTRHVCMIALCSGPIPSCKREPTLRCSTAAACGATQPANDSPIKINGFTNRWAAGPPLEGRFAAQPPKDRPTSRARGRSSRAGRRSYRNITRRGPVLRACVLPILVLRSHGRRTGFCRSKRSPGCGSPPWPRCWQAWSVNRAPQSHHSARGSVI
jgi:hypothetical protein